MSVNPEILSFALDRWADRKRNIVKQAILEATGNSTLAEVPNDSLRVELKNKNELYTLGDLPLVSFGEWSTLKIPKTNELLVTQKFEILYTIR